MTERTARIDAEWIALNAFRGLVKIASKGDLVKSAYDKALHFGGELYPELLGPETSVLRRDQESDTTKEFRQKAELLSRREKATVSPLVLVRVDIEEYKGLLSFAELNRSDKNQVDQLKRRLAQLTLAERELDPTAHSEHQLIFRDAYNADRDLPSLGSGQGFRDFQLPDANVLRVRVLHPDKPEHISGADIIYERHDPAEGGVSIVAVQYKIWSDRKLYLTDPRLQTQLQRLAKFTCGSNVCEQPRDADGHTYRFPCCAGFLRPTDKLQKTDQKYFSTGEHLPICKIDQCKVSTAREADVLRYKDIRHISLNSEMFEYLFNRGKIGSRTIPYIELQKLYAEYSVASAEDSVVIYAQEFVS